jgi:hypothetical protein
MVHNGKKISEHELERTRPSLKAFVWRDWTKWKPSARIAGFKADRWPPPPQIQCGGANYSAATPSHMFILGHCVCQWTQLCTVSCLVKVLFAAFRSSHHCLVGAFSQCLRIKFAYGSCIVQLMSWAEHYVVVPITHTWAHVPIKSQL